MTKSETSYQTTLIRKENAFELSVYKGELTKECIARSAVKLNRAFPALPAEFFDVFSDRIKDHSFNDERLKAAINHVIDNCVFPAPTVAQFISFDKRIKVYSYKDMLRMNEELSGKAFQYYKAVKIGNNKMPVWAHVNDIEEYKLKLWNNGED